MTKTGAKAAGALVLALAVGGAAHAANLVTDGDFSSPSGGPTFTTYAAGSSFDGWSVTSGSVDLIGGYWQAPTPGGGSVDLDGNAPGAISQSIATGTGEYTLWLPFDGITALTPGGGGPKSGGGGPWSTTDWLVAVLVTVVATMSGTVGER